MARLFKILFSLCLLWYIELVALVLPPPHTHTIRHVSWGPALQQDCTFSDFGLDHLACFGQQKMSKRNAGRGLGYTEWLGAPLHLCLHQECTSQLACWAGGMRDTRRVD